MEEGICTICRTPTRSTPYLSAQAEGTLFHYQRCSVCGLVFLNPRPDPEQLLRYYGRDYYGGGERKFTRGIEALRLLFALRRVYRLQRYLPRAGRALDIGCGQGAFLQLLRRQGWAVQGTELMEEPARRARQAGIPVFLGEIQEGQLGEGSLDLVTLWHVIEHLRDPAGMLRRISLMVGKKGLVALSTPNVESTQARVFRERWFHLDPPRHLYLFSPETLHHLMAQAGFRMIYLNHFSLEQNPYGWVQSALNRMAFPGGDLYSFLKSQPGRKRPENSPFLAKMLLLSAALLLPSILISLLMAWRGEGGTLEAYFIKDEAGCG
ncbi:MAG TPA: class I SAM-dependent methyltransferase [Thermodesulfobacteriota bacterium]|nr:class I SAM-dependent methyltransferase [Thermodesulfobacteriota bacterium]